VPSGEDTWISADRSCTPNAAEWAASTVDLGCHWWCGRTSVCSVSDEPLHSTRTVVARYELHVHRGWHCYNNHSILVVVIATRRSTLGNQAFPVSAARARNSLPSTVIAAPSLSSFHRALKTHLYTVSFLSWHNLSWQPPRLVYDCVRWSCSFLTLRHLNLFFDMIRYDITDV